MLNHTFKAVWVRKGGVRIEYYMHTNNAHIIIPMIGSFSLSVTFDALWDLFGAPKWY